MQGIIFDVQRWSLHDGPGIRSNIFLKGCPLSCLWCSNPESQDKNKELAFFKDKCIGCLCCIKDCHYGAITQGENGRRINYKICKEHCYDEKEHSFSCAKECYAEALKIMGRTISVEQVMEEVLCDEEIYKKSGGGITVTGGEPFSQPEFLYEILKAAKEKGIHTAIESCLFAKWEVIEKCLPFINFIFMDFKILDETEHKKYTGVSNQLILENMKKLSDYKKNHEIDIVVRTPIIPEVNDDVKTVQKMCEWIVENLPEIKEYQLLPYHRLGRGKYANIGKKYAMNELEAPSESKMRELEKQIERHGLIIANY